MTKHKYKYIDSLMMILILILMVPILIKSVTNIYLAYDLMQVDSYNRLLIMLEHASFHQELLFRLALIFSDFKITFNNFINTLTLFDILPFLMMILIFEINRITKKNKKIYLALCIILMVYILKYLGFLIVVFAILYGGLNIIVGIHYLAIWFIIITLSFGLGIMYLINAYTSLTKVEGLEMR